MVLMSIWIPLILGAALSSPGTAVMVHGAGGGGWEYDFWAKVFRSKGWRVVAKDLLPGRQGLAATTFDDYRKHTESWARGAKRPLLLVGASMGGVLVLKAAEKLKPDALILINSALPKGIADPAPFKPYPPVVRWANGPLKETEDAMPDSDRKTVLWAWKKWRDESGLVMNELRGGIEVQRPSCPVLVLIGEKDTDVPPDKSAKLGRYLGADSLAMAGTSHVGPLLGRRASEAAELALNWTHLRLKLDRR